MSTARPSASRTSEAVLLLVVLVLAAEPFRSSGPVVFGISVTALGYFCLAGPVRLPPVPIGIFLAWCFASMLWSVDPSLTLRGAIATTTTTAVVYLAVCQLGREALLRTLTRAFQVLIVVSWLVFLALPSVGREQFVHPGAFKGIFVQRNTAAFVIGAAALTFLYITVSGSGRTRWTGVWLLVAVVTVISAESGTGLAAMTLSAAFLLMLLAVNRRSPFERLSLVVVLALAGVGGLVLALSGIAGAAQLLGRDTSLTGRTVIWEAIDPYARQELWTGFGWGALWTPDTFVTRQIWGKAHFEFSHAHNAYLDTTLQVGALGLALVLVAVLATVVLGLRRYLAGGRTAAPYCLVVVVFLLIYALTERSFVSYFGWALLVAAYGLVKLPAEAVARTPPTELSRVTVATQSLGGATRAS